MWLLCRRINNRRCYITLSEVEKRQTSVTCKISLHCKWNWILLQKDSRSKSYQVVFQFLKVNKLFGKGGFFLLCVFYLVFLIDVKDHTPHQLVALMSNLVVHHPPLQFTWRRTRQLHNAICQYIVVVSKWYSVGFYPQ